MHDIIYLLDISGSRINDCRFYFVLKLITSLLHASYYLEYFSHAYDLVILWH